MKMILVGDGGVGKTTYLKRLITGDFERKYVPTLGVDVKIYEYPGIAIDGNNITSTKYDIWDTAGQERFGGLREGYYIGADVAIVMFDVNSKLSFNNVSKWINEIRKIKNIPIVLCGNKIDIPSKRAVSNSSIKELCNQYNMPYYDISAKSNYNYEKPFEYFEQLNQSLNNYVMV